jgi:hypothetical protein
MNLKSSTPECFVNEKNLTNMIMDTWLLPSPLLHNHHSRLTLPLSSISPKTSAEVYNARMLNHKQKNMTSMASVPCFLKIQSYEAETKKAVMGANK